MADFSQQDIQDVLDTLIAEAGGQGEESMRRVAETMLNRAAIRGLSLGDVVRERSQYTGYSAPGPAAVQAQGLASMRASARRALDEALKPGDPTGGADHYFNPSIVNPGWRNSMRHTGDFGGHAYYSSRPIPPADLENAVATALDVVQPTRDVPFPRQRPEFRQVDRPRTRPERVTTIATVPTVPRTVDAPGESFFFGRGVPQTFQRAAEAQRPDTAAGLAAFLNGGRRAAPPMPTNVAQSYAGQERTGGSSTARNLADVLVPTRPQTYAGQERVVTPSTAQALVAALTPSRPQSYAAEEAAPARARPAPSPAAPARSMPAAPARPQSYAGQDRVSPTTSRSLAEVLTPLRPQSYAAQEASPARAGATAARSTGNPTVAAQRTSAQASRQQRADAQQTVAAAPRRVPLTIGAASSFAGQDRAPTSRLDPVSGPVSFSQVADLFAPVPSARGSTNEKKDQSRLPSQNWTVPDAQVAELHGLVPPAPVMVADRVVPRPRPRPNAAATSRVAVTSPTAAPRGGVVPRAAPRLAPQPALAFASTRPQGTSATRAIGDLLAGSSRSSGVPSFAGTSSGRTYSPSARYTMGGDTYRANADGSFTNERTGRTFVGSSTPSRGSGVSITGSSGSYGSNTSISG